MLQIDDFINNPFIKYPLSGSGQFEYLDADIINDLRGSSQSLPKNTGTVH
jgi:hypothetical protein